MIAKIMDAFFGCWHSHYSFPMTVRPGAHSRTKVASITGTYVVCLDCGKELPYDWKEMRIVDSASERRKAVQLAEKHAA